MPSIHITLSHHLRVNTAIHNEGFTLRREFLTSLVIAGPRSTISYNTLEKNDRIIDSISREMLCLVAKCSWLKCVFISVEVYAPGECAIGYMSAEKKRIKTLWLSLGKANQTWQYCSAFFWLHALKMQRGSVFS